MAENADRQGGLPTGYKDDRGQQPVRYGTYVGIVKNNVDPTRQGRLEVYIEQFNTNGYSENDVRSWTTVSYATPFYGTIDPNSARPNETAASTESFGTFENNPVSYGMWFTPPDIGVKVLIVYLNGDASNPVYIGVLPNQATNHMIPAIGAQSNYVLANTGMQEILGTAKMLPVTELNENNTSAQSDPKFYSKPRPVHKILAGQFFVQGLLNDNVRGPITSSSQRESPSSAYGISTPGRPIYSNSTNQEAAINGAEGNVTPNNVIVVGRQGGHSFVLDDGDIAGKNNLVRLRSSSGHQITMSDDGKTIYIVHANGQSWVELGAEGTVDVFSTNSINLRTKGQLNLHADRDININAGGLINMKAGTGMAVESATDISFKCKASLTLWSGFKLGLKSNGILTMVSKAGSWDSGSSMALEAKTISLNGGKVDSLQEPQDIPVQKLPDVNWNDNTGWTQAPSSLQTITTRAPTHEPYLYHNTGVDNNTSIVRLLGNTGDITKTAFAGQIYGKDITVIDMTPRFAIKQINIATNNVGAAGSTAAAVSKGYAAQYLDNLTFQTVNMNVNQALAINPELIKAAGALQALSNPAILQQFITQYNLGVSGATANIASPAINNVTQILSNLNNLGYGLVSGGGVGGAIGQGVNIGGVTNGIGAGISNAVTTNLSTLLSGNGIGQVLGQQITNAILKNIGLDTATITSKVLQSLGIDTKAISGSLDSALKGFQGELSQLGKTIGQDLSAITQQASEALQSAVQGIGDTLSASTEAAAQSIADATAELAANGIFDTAAVEGAVSELGALEFGMTEGFFEEGAAALIAGEGIGFAGLAGGPIGIAAALVFSDFFGDW